MKKSKLVLGLGAVALVATLTIGGTLAYFTDADEAQNVFTMGKVDGELTEPSWNYDEEGITDVMPGQEISKDPTLTLADGSENAYVRFMVTTDLDDAHAADIKFLKDGEEVEGLAFGEYYYVDDAMSAGDTYVLFDKVVIPASWGNEMVEKTFNIDVRAEMVQEANFDPADWDTITIEELN